MVKCNIGFLSEASEAIVLASLNWGVFPQKMSNVNIHYKPLEWTETLHLNCF